MPQIESDWSPLAATDKRLLELHDHWLRLSRDGALPLRANLRPAALAALLPFIFLVDVLDNPRDFRFRLAGTAFAEGSGQELTGRTIAEVFPPEFHAEVFTHWNSVIHRRHAKWGRGKVWNKEREFMRWQGVILPLQSEEGVISQFLGGATFDTSS